MDHYLEVLALPMIAGWLEVGSLGVVQIWNFSQSLVIYFSTKNGNGPSFANSFRFLQFLPEKYENHCPPNVVDVLNFVYQGNLVNWSIFVFIIIKDFVQKYNFQKWRVGNTSTHNIKMSKVYAKWEGGREL